MPYIALAKTVLIDEAHRFKHVDWVVPTLAHMGKRVYVSFNSGNTALIPWPGAGELLAHADHVEIRRGTCLKRGCRRNAPFTAPIPTDQRRGASGLMVGPMCRGCLNRLRLSAITGQPTRPPTRDTLVGQAEGRVESLARPTRPTGPTPHDPKVPRNDDSPRGTIVVTPSPDRSIVVDRATLLPGPEMYQELMAGISEMGSLTLPSFREASRLVTMAREGEDPQIPQGQDQRGRPPTQSYLVHRGEPSTPTTLDDRLPSLPEPSVKGLVRLGPPPPLPRRAWEALSAIGKGERIGRRWGGYRPSIPCGSLTS